MITKITKSDGTPYSIRKDRRRYFFPQEWEAFIKTFKNKEHRFFFLTLLHTGARIMEALNLQHKDIETERGTVRFTTTKQRKARKDYFSTGKDRSFFVASNYIKEYKAFTRGKTINPDHYIFLDNAKLPQNYSELPNPEKEQYWKSRFVAYSRMLKRKLKKAGIEDWRNFSPHNIRKTYGMWMRSFDKDMGELCYRMGHDMKTFIAHYGSSLIFTQEERRDIQKIMGDVR